jgi:hypothetical protein
LGDSDVWDLAGDPQIERMGESRPQWRWGEAAVDRSEPHLRIVHDEHPSGVVALVGQPENGAFPVEFLVGPDEREAASVLEDVRRELDFYLVEKGEPDPWGYAHYHCWTMANVMGKVHWGTREDFVGIPYLNVVGDPFGGDDLVRLEDALAPVVGQAWELHRQATEVPEGRAVTPSIPILFFGDLDGYWRSPRRVVTVGLNPSKEEFPEDDPWLRFPRGAEFGPASTNEYLEELSGYFGTKPYRRWFNNSFEPMLNGIDASYYRDGEGVSAALHTDIASPVATSPTWRKLAPQERAVHQGGAEIWRALVDLLAPDVILVSVASEHLGAVATTSLGQWEELTRVERTRPYIVSTTEMVVAKGQKSALVVFGQAAQLPFGTVSFGERRRIGQEIATLLDARSRGATG